MPKLSIIVIALSLVPYCLLTYKHGTEVKKRPPTANYVRRVWERK